MLCVPKGFDPQQILPINLRRYGDCARFILHRIHYGMVFERRCRDTGWVNLKAKYLGKFCANHYEEIRDALIEAGAVEFNRRWIVGRYSCGFRIAPGWQRRGFEQVAISYKPLLKQLDKWERERSKGRPITSVHQHLAKMLGRIEIDTARAMRAIGDIGGITWEQAECCRAAVLAIRDRDFRHSVCSYGRFHSNLTNLKREMRPFLSVDGLPLVCLDIRNSQPVFSCLLLVNLLRNDGFLQNVSLFDCQIPEDIIQGFFDNQDDGDLDSWEMEAISTTTPNTTQTQYDPSFRIFVEDMGLGDDLRHYVRLCEQGQLYDYFMERLEIPDNRRTEFKREFFGHYFFSQNRVSVRTPIGKLFAETFPTIDRAMRQLKANDYTFAARLMQKMESEFVIGRVVGRIMRELPQTFVATIHDALLTTEGQAEDVRKVMLEEFEAFGLRPTIQVDRLVEDHVLKSA